MRLRDTGEGDPPVPRAELALIEGSRLYCISCVAALQQSRGGAVWP